MGFDELSGRVIGAAVEVHRQLGPGFVESVYERALKVELGRRGIKYQSQKPVQISYGGQVVGNHILDLVIEDRLIVELKAVARFEDVHLAQVRSYLCATGLSVGLLMNFNSATLDVKRIVFNYDDKGQRASTAQYPE